MKRPKKTSPQPLHCIVERELLDVHCRFGGAFHADFKHVVIDFVKLQLEYSQKVHAAWAALLPQLDAIETPPPA